MFDNFLPYVPVIAAALAALSTAGVLTSRVRRLSREAVHRRWTEQQEAHLRAAGPRFKLQVLRKDRASLEWAVGQGRLRVTKDMPWGWYVVAETRLAPRSQ